MRVTCTSCESAVDHCHGTLIVHAGRMPECTDPGCTAFCHARHTFIVDCFDIAGGCACATETPTRRQA
ncbi:hypothetical protein [Nocardia xishanensis]|uniref:hypothetical protein n=1 Tax=Nocardia xishanensis TaxID=238964 RepID=UPI0009FEF0BF|nr:hypothetical protein [Nocardia xishanensis]